MKLKHLITPNTLSERYLSSAQISSIGEIENEIDETTLVVFDIDEVLITTEDHFVHPYAEKIFLSHVNKVMSSASTHEERREIEKRLSLSVLLPKRVLVENGAPAMISRLQQRGVKVVALTTCPTGPFGIIPQLERWRIEHLQSLNISFAAAFPELNRYVFETLKDEEKYTPLFEEGILFSPGYSKGDVLKAFLDHVQWRPSKVVFIDDLATHIASLETTLQPIGIPYKGFQYLGAERFFKPIDEKVLQYQFSHLIDTKEWLSDQEVVHRLGGAVRPFLVSDLEEKDFFRADSGQPYHLSIGAVLFDQNGRIACHHFKEILGQKDIYILMRETMEANETPLMTLNRGLMEEFSALAQPTAFLGCLSGPSVELGLSYNKTTLYFACQLLNWMPKERNLQDTEGGSIIEWLKPDQLMAIMQNQGARFQRVDADESEVIRRALPYLACKEVVATN